MSAIQTFQCHIVSGLIQQSAENGLPDKCKNFAADFKLSGLLVGDHALVGGKDGSAESVKNLRNFILLCIDAQAGLGDSLKAGDDLVILVCARFSSWKKGYQLYRVLQC